MKEFIELSANKNSLANRKLVHGAGINDADYVTTPAVDGKQKSLGLYLTEEEAHQAYMIFKRELIIITANREPDLKLKNALLRITHTKY